MLILVNVDACVSSLRLSTVSIEFEKGESTVEDVKAKIAEKEGSHPSNNGSSSVYSDCKTSKRWTNTT